MWNWPKNSEHFKYELLSILGEMKEQEEEKDGAFLNYALDAIEDLQYAISLSVIAVEQHCRNWMQPNPRTDDSGIQYQETIEVFIKKVNQILSEEQWSFK